VTAARPEAGSAPVAAIVLAAGRSSRMGRQKPLLPFGEGTVLAHVVGELRAAGIVDVRVVLGHDADEPATACAALGVRAVLNPDYDRGMFSSIRAGIADLPADVAGTLLLPVDVPLVRATTFTTIVATARATDPTILHPTFRGERGHPPFLARRLFPAIFAHDGAGGLAALLARREADTDEVAVVDRGILCDMDVPEDYARLVELLAHRRHPEAIECEAILDAAVVSDRVRRHVRAVAAFAATLAERLAAGGLALDVDLVRAAALLHDVAKGLPRHAETGAAVVSALGFPEVAAVIARHMDLGEDVGTEPPIDETAIVYLADKLFREDRLVGLEERFAQAFRRFRDDPAALAGARRRHGAAEAIRHAVAGHIDWPWASLDEAGAARLAEPRREAS